MVQTVFPSAMCVMERMTARMVRMKKTVNQAAVKVKACVCFFVFQVILGLVSLYWCDICASLPFFFSFFLSSCSVLSENSL